MWINSILTIVLGNKCIYYSQFYVGTESERSHLSDVTQLEVRALSSVGVKRARVLERRMGEHGLHP